MFVGLLEDDLTSPDICHEALQWLLDDQLDSHGGSQVIHHIDARHDRVDEIGVQNRTEDEFHIGATHEVFDVGEPTGGEVVEQNELVSPVEKKISEMRPDETGSSGDQNLHAHRLLPCLPRQWDRAEP